MKEGQTTNMYKTTTLDFQNKKITILCLQNYRDPSVFKHNNN